MITSAQEYLANLQKIRDENLHTEPLVIPADELIPDASGDIFVPKHAGTYYFIAKNKVEETEAE